MGSIKKLSITMLAMTVLAACTTTNTNLKTTAQSPKTSTSSSSGQLRTVSQVYSSVVSEQKFGPEVPRVYADNLNNNQKIVIKMQPNFGRDFLLCEGTASCEKVNIAAEQNPITAGDYDDVDPLKNLIAEVELSDKIKSLRGLGADGLNNKKILIMRPDVELSELSAGGMKEPNALWTSTATNYVTEITAQYFQNLGYDASIYKDNANGVSEKTGQDLINLHEAVGLSILLYQQNPMLRLPTLANGRFDWELGKTTKKLNEAYGAKYGLFVYLRDSYSSGSRVAAQVLMAALFGTTMQGGQQIGFASLVDLETGELHWFNRIHSTTGDLRTFDATINATNALYSDIPL